MHGNYIINFSTTVIPIPVKCSVFCSVANEKAGIYSRLICGVKQIMVYSYPGILAEFIIYGFNGLIGLVYQELAIGVEE